MSRAYILKETNEQLWRDEVLIYSLHKHSSRRKVSLTIKFLQLKKICTLKKGILVARDFQSLAFLESPEITLLTDVTVANVGSPETNKQP